MFIMTVLIYLTRLIATPQQPADIEVNVLKEVVSDVSPATP